MTREPLVLYSVNAYKTPGPGIYRGYSNFLLNMAVISPSEVENIPSKKSSAQVDVWVNSFLTRNGYIKCYISLFKEIILQQCDAFQTVIQDSLTKPCAIKASRGHPSKMVNNQ